MTTPNASPSSDRSPRWPWLVLAMGLLWTSVLRIPLILAAADHLDSDLAVDGLTLLDAVNGSWRWHYPGTPHMGILPVLLSYPQALLYGVSPATLVSGGLVAWLLVITATFVLAWRAFGAGVACWAIVPLVFSSVGTVWLSGRITGGHLLTLAWHAAAFAGMVGCLTRGGAWRSGLLGLWCGLGLYLDTMVVFTMAGLVPAAVASWWVRGKSNSGKVAAVVFVLGLVLGVVPRELGKRADPYDPYGQQFAPIFQPSVIADHARILVMDCLPRLIVGHELPDLQSTPEALTELGRPARTGPEDASPSLNAGPYATALGLLLFVAAIVRLIRDRSPQGSAERAVQHGVLISAGLILVAFLINRNIFNSDNYRYLIFLLVPWSLGFGLVMRSIASRGAAAWAATLFLSALFGAVMTASVVSWYVGLGWLSVDLLRGSPVSSEGLVVFQDRETPADEDTPPAAILDRATVLPAGTSHVFGDYWKVYRIAFLSGGRVVGVPFPTYPNRFEGWSSGLEPGQGALFVLDPVPDWRAMLLESWRREDRDPNELDQLTLLTP
ncbi:hypothetical protein [Tautonia rosea]|uniref:hypothetical protein n=1 Tax=Tautonia rosea TaxID=2728037 RepID=UPI001473CB78|nr:hypothetical protein [Tautonia rosea]